MPKRLITGGDPEARAPVPQEAEFAQDDNPDANEEYIDGTVLRKIAVALIGEYGELSDLEGLRIDYLWQFKGSSRGLKPTMGTVKKVQGLTRHYARKSLVVIVAADHVRTLEMTAWQLEALVHELLSSVLVEEGKISLQPPDVEGRHRNIFRYGLWHHDLKRTGDVIKQLAMDFAA